MQFASSNSVVVSQEELHDICWEGANLLSRTKLERMVGERGERNPCECGKEITMEARHSTKFTNDACSDHR